MSSDMTDRGVKACRDDDKHPRKREYARMIAVYQPLEPGSPYHLLAQRFAQEKCCREETHSGVLSYTNLNPRVSLGCMSQGRLRD